MYLEHRIKIEDEERERRYLESIGPIGRLVDNELHFALVLMILMLGSFMFGFLIGVML